MGNRLKYESESDPNVFALLMVATVLFADTILKCIMDSDITQIFQFNLFSSIGTYAGKKP